MRPGPGETVGTGRGSVVKKTRLLQQPLPALNSQNIPGKMFRVARSPGLVEVKVAIEQLSLVIGSMKSAPAARGGTSPLLKQQ